MFNGKLWLIAFSAASGAAPLRAAQEAGGYLAGALGGMETGTAQALTPPTLLPTLLNVVFSLAFVVALIFAAYWLLLKWRDRQGLPQGARVGLIRVLERQFIDARHSVAVVEVGDEILTLGLGENVTLLAGTDDAGAVERMRSMAPLPATVMGFKEQLERVGMRLRKEEWGRAKQDLKRQSAELKAETDRIKDPRGGGR